MADSRLQGIVRRLIDRTAAGDQSWTAASTDPPIFMTRVGDYGVLVDSVDGDGRFPYRVEIRDVEGELVEQEETRTLTTQMSEATRTEVRNSNRRMASLYDAARREALGIDKALDEIEEILGE